MIPGTQLVVELTLGDIQSAIKMYENIIKLCKNEWMITFGETIDQHKRSIDRLKSMLT